MRSWFLCEVLVSVSKYDIDTLLYVQNIRSSVLSLFICDISDIEMPRADVGIPLELTISPL